MYTQVELTAFGKTSRVGKIEEEAGSARLQSRRVTSAMPFGTAQLTTLAAAALRSWPSNRTLKAGELWTGHDGPTDVYAVRRLG